MRRDCKIGLTVGFVLIVIGLVLTIHQSIHVRDISFLPMSAGIAVVFVFGLRFIGRRISASE
ncbi:hypothetical protein AKJ65_03860 [candidate division MSBL1 archaeon SCGC-AAA259E19]|uniref:Uncharacterized protein n=1 Tax=candidate division MSBL1 archaeon SCGC-AAA259E19 TaxID=1698264 RepID=A0A133UKC5_9EURY|nr:hypothetical protein AKJ65_03860 [candidate division MSBL1 archaeon SCGC-AAA259E19]